MKANEDNFISLIKKRREEGNTESNFAPVKAYYEGLLSHLGWKDAGIVYAGGNMDPGDIRDRPEQLAQAEALGKAL